ncbi:PAS domain-containing protein [Pedobacter antarcticus]|uniref:PAS domain-containing protein n=1 Tax=Pedobacter antarcticus TaxID=34086 RepID=UPI001C597487|nr:PAS domain S-box protein [Pedobacter antarcticus]
MGFFGHEMVQGLNTKTEDLLSLLQAYQQAVNTSIISSITDTKGKILYVNSSFCKVSQYTSEELIGQDHRIINSGYHPRSYLKQMWKTIGNGGVWHGEIKNRAKDGSFYWVDSVIAPIKGENGKPEKYLSLRTLISGRKALEKQQKEERSKNMQEMLFRLSHEVRQPVAQILGLTALLEDSDNSPEDVKTSLEMLQRAASQLDRYTRELATFVSGLKNE